MNNTKLFSLTESDCSVARERILQGIENGVKDCQQCPLSKTRRMTVIGEGNYNTDLMFIGEAPGSEEDQSGRPFVGKAGELLTQILHSVNISREDIYITNIVKCRPPKNRVPEQDEIMACNEYLESQIILINPKLIVLLGNTPAKTILNTTTGITRLRGHWYNWNGIAVMPMFHPSYLLRNSSSREGSPKHLTWIDIQEVKRQLDAIRTTGVFTNDFKFG